MKFLNIFVFIFFLSTFSAYGKENRKKFLEDLLSEKINTEKFEKTVHDAEKEGVAKIKIPLDTLKKISVPNRPDPTKPPPNHMKRYGQEKNPIFAFILYGKKGSPGAVYIYTPGEKVKENDFDHFLGPLHYHPDVSHFSIVTQGRGLFYLERIKDGKKHLEKFEATEGDAFFIPANKIHTFWAGNTGNFDVLAFSSKLIPTDSPEFQKVVKFSELGF